MAVKLYRKKHLHMFYPVKQQYPTKINASLKEEQTEFYTIRF